MFRIVSWVLGCTALLWAAPAGAQTLYYTGYQTAPLSEQAVLCSSSAEAPSRALSAAAIGVAGQTDSASPARRISRRKAIGASLLLPGWGQWLTGNRGRAKAFFVTELGIAATYAFFGVQGKVRKNRYIDYAEQFAGIEDAGGKEDTYYRNLGVYSDSEEYVEFVQSTARALYGDDLDKRDAYVARYAPTAADSWEWVSDGHRLDYREQRKDSRNSYRRASHMLGIALLNRVLSAIAAAFAAGSPSPRQNVYVETAEDGTNYVGLRLKLD